MPGTDSYQQNVPYPKLSDTPNVETALQTLVNAGVVLSNMRFPNTATRNAVITHPVAGMETWLVAENRKEIYDGTTWNAYVPSPTWVAYTPVWTGLQTLGASTSTGRYCRVGKRVDVIADLTGGAGTSLGTGFINVTLPFPAATIGSVNSGWQGVGRFSAGTGIAWRTMISTAERGVTTAGLLAVRPSDNGWSTPGDAGYPWVPGSLMRMQLTYEVA